MQPGVRAGPSNRPDDIDVLALDEALTRLAALDAEQARIVELRYFGGLTVEETAEAVGVSPATVKRQWAMARAWLKRALEGAARRKWTRPPVNPEQFERAQDRVPGRARPAGDVRARVAARSMRRRQRAAARGGVAPRHARDRRRLSRAAGSDRPDDLDALPDPDTRVGPYQIIAEIGRGGMGIVYLAEDERLGRRVALKSLPAGSPMQPDLRERLRREARAAATISHPAVAVVYRARGSRRQSVHRHGVRAGRDAEKRDRRGPTPPSPRTGSIAIDDRRGARGGARRRRGPPRPEAGERADHVETAASRSWTSASRMSRAPTRRA